MSSLPGPVLLISDVHAQYQVVNEQIADAEARLGEPLAQVFVLGDFGLFRPNLRAHFRRKGLRFTRPVAFIEGNHEDFGEFDQLTEAFADVVTHLPRGSVHDYGAWRLLCVGGARYMDALSTPSGAEITDADVERCLSHHPTPIDIVLSHDCPTGIGVQSESGLDHLGPPGHPGLARVAARLRPRWWFFGHHHHWHESTVDGTCYFGLPQSWEGYVILEGDHAPRRIQHTVKLPPTPWWLRIVGLQ